MYQSQFPQEIELESPQKKPEVSIIVPTRNEERNIKRCLESLINLNYENKEIIVVDGNSNDSTVQIARQFSDVIVISEPSRPNTWVGKPWACYNGYLNATGEILLFTDADTSHDPRSLDALVTELHKTDGFLSFITTQVFDSFWEHMLSIVFLIISLTVRGTKGTKNAQIANGQYMMFTRERYEDLGTHQVVGDSIIEDLAFATYSAKHGSPPHIVYRHHLVTTRMYHNLDDIREGFGKNLGLGVDQAGVSAMIPAGLISIWATGWIILLLISLLSGNHLSFFNFAVIFGGYVSFTLLLYGVESKIATRGSLYVVFNPIYYLMFQIIVFQSLYHTFVSKEIIWKNQVYDL